MMNKRDSFRLRKQMDVSWSVPQQKVEGQGKIFNISLSGMTFETDRLFQPEHGMTVCFGSREIPSLPSKGKLAWFKKAGTRHYQCGIKFVKEASANHTWAQWMEENVLKLADTGDNKILNRYITSEEQE